MSSNSLSLPPSSTTEGPWLAPTYIIILLGGHRKRPRIPGSLTGAQVTRVCERSSNDWGLWKEPHDWGLWTKPQWLESMKGAPMTPITGVYERRPRDWGQWLEPQKETFAGGSMRKHPHLLLARPLNLQIRVCSHTYVICSEITLAPNLHFGFFSVPALPTYLHFYHHSDVVNESENCVCSFRIKIETLSNSH